MKPVRSLVLRRLKGPKVRTSTLRFQSRKFCQRPLWNRQANRLPARRCRRRRSMRRHLTTAEMPFLTKRNTTKRSAPLPRRSGSTQITNLPTAIEAVPTSIKAIMTRRSGILTRRSGSIQGWPWRTTAVESLMIAKVSSTRPLMTTATQSGSIQIWQKRTTIEESPIPNKVTSTRPLATTMTQSGSTQIMPEPTTIAESPMGNKVSMPRRLATLPKRSGSTQILCRPTTIAGPPMRNKETSIRPTLTLRQRSGSRRGNKKLSFARKTAGRISDRSRTVGGRLKETTQGRESPVGESASQHDGFSRLWNQASIHGRENEGSQPECSKTERRGIGNRLNLRRRCGFVAHERSSQALANDPYEEKSKLCRRKHRRRGAGRPRHR